jgi:phage gpG-like protein
MPDPFISLGYDDKDVTKRLQKLADRARNPEPALKEFREVILYEIEQGFEKEVSPEGLPWKPNSRFTIRLKRALGRIQKINQSTGRMRSSITGQIIGGNTLVIGTNVSYAVDRQRENPFLGVSKTAKEEGVKIFDKYLMED